MIENKELNEKIAAFAGLKKVKNVKTIVDGQTFVSEEVWVHRFDPIQDEQMIYNDAFPKKELISSEDIIDKLTYHLGGDSLMAVYDQCHKLLLGLMRNGKITPEYMEGSNILGSIHKFMFDTTHTYQTIGKFIDWYNENKEKFALLKNNP